MSERVWEILERVARGAEEVVIVAPYMKEEPLRRVLGLVADSAGVTCVTRWQRADVASGVSDVACRTLIKERGGRFLLHQRLHAKYYRFGDVVLVGSANLTGAGMGYVSPANREILCEPGAGFDAEAFEAEVRRIARGVTDAEFARWAAIEVASPVTEVASPGQGAVTEAGAPSEWRPMTRVPENLWLAYRDESGKIVSADERERARDDLESLRIPAGLDRARFDSFVSTELLSSAAVADVRRTEGLEDHIAWTQLAEEWDTTRSDAQRFRETAWNWITTFLR